MKPYYDDGLCVIYHGDNLDVMATIVESPDLIFTSPPYNLGSEPWPHLGNWRHGAAVGGNGKWRGGGDASSGITYDEHTDSMPWPDYVAWQQEVLSECWYLLPDDGAVYYNHKPRVVGGRLWTPLELIPPEAVLRQIVTWARKGGLNYTPVAYVPMYEWVVVLAKGGFRLRSQAASGAGDVWHVAQDQNNAHPAPFPVGLPARAIETTAPRLVMDPFMGSGTTLRAAKDAGVRAIGIDTSEAYCEMAAKRLEQASVFAPQGAPAEQGMLI